MKIKDFLGEGLSPILFHATSIENMKKIVEQNRFRLQPVFGSHEYAHGGQGFFMSTSRSRTGSYAENIPGGYSVMMTLDGNLLSRILSGKSIDFYQNQEDGRFHELEDRMFHHKPSVDNASNYIKAIDVNLDGLSMFLTKSKIQDLKDIKSWADKNSIPITFYQDYRSFASRSPKGVVSAESVLGNKGVDPVAPPVPKKDAELHNTLLRNVYQLAKYIDSPKNNTLDKTFAMDLVGGDVSRFDIMKATKNATDEELLTNVYRYMRKRGLKKASDLYDHIRSVLVHIID